MLLPVTIFLLVGFHVSLSYEFVREYRLNKDEEGDEENRERETVEQRYRRRGLKEWRKEGETG